MIDVISVNIDSNGKVKTSSKTLCNQYENGVAQFKLNVPPDWQDDSYFYYLCVVPPESAGIKQYAVPLTEEFIFLISSGITWHLGTWKFVFMVLNSELPDTGVVPTEGIVSISDSWEGSVNKSILNLDDLAEQPVDPNFTLLYTDLMALRNSVENIGEYAQTQGDYAKVVGEQLLQDKEDGVFDGDDGVSPTVTVHTSTSTEYTLDITDVNGTTTTPNLRGADGSDGQDGTDGTSPTVTVNTSTDTIYKLDITDVNGTITTPNLKGADGEPGTTTYSDLSDKPSINGVTLSGNKTSNDLGLNSQYLALSGGGMHGSIDMRGYAINGASTVEITSAPFSTTDAVNKAYADTKEKSSNKITTINNSSTDTQYPSAKAVYDYAASKTLYTDTTINTGRSANSTTGTYSTAVGIANIASGQCAVSEGEECEASGEASHAGGMGSVASGTESLAFGDYVTASGEASVALGKETLAQSDNQFANGKYNVGDSNDTYAEILGNGRWVAGTGAVRSNARTTDWQGNGWFAGDVYVGSTSGTNKDAGSKKLATEEFVSDNYIAEPSTEGTSGQVLTTDGNGGRTWTTVSGGGGTSDYTQLSNKPQINNVTLTGNKSLSDLGIAAANGVINATDLTVSNNSVNLVDYVNTPGIYKVPSSCWIYTDSARSTANRIYAIPGDIVKIEPQIDAGDGEEIVEFDSYFTVFGTIVYAGNMITADNVTWTSSVVPYEHQGNKVTTISSSSKNAQYPSAKAVYDYAASKALYGDTTINTGRSANTTVGTASAALGQYNTASARDSFAIGISNTASGSDSVVSGEECTASGETAIAGGMGSVASGDESLAFGDYVTASGDISTAFGKETLAQSENQFAFGKFNVGDSNNTYAEILGNGRWVVGTGAVRSNARTTDWSGNGWYAGNIKVGGTGYSDSNAKELATKDYIDSLVVEGAKKVMLYDGKSNNAAILTGVTQELTDSIFNYDLIVVGFNVLVGSTRVMELTMPVYPKSSLIVFCDSTGTGATGAYHIVNANTAFATGNAYRVMWGFTDATHIRNIISNQVGWASPGICYVIGYKFSTLPEGYATETYVDNAIASAVTSAIGGSY